MVMKMGQSKRPIQNPLVVLREEFDNWAILFNPDTANAVGVNPVGVAVWRMIDGQKDVEDMVFEIKKGFSDVPTSAQMEIASFIDDLHKGGFVGFETEGA
jgi:SynChlorMet cassette protein ScmD